MRTKARFRPAVLVMLAGLAMTAVAACGADGEDPGVATVAGSDRPDGTVATATANSDQDSGLAFAKCVRENGIPEFADPKTDGGGMKMSLPQGIDLAKFEAVRETCKQYLPNGGELPKPDPQMQEQARKFAQCMRENGVSAYPDPDENGGIGLDFRKLGMNRDDPRFTSAQDACKQYNSQPSGIKTPAGDGPR